MPPRRPPHPLMFLLVVLVLFFPLTAHLQAPLIAADLRLPHAAWSLDMRVGPVRFRTGAFEIGQSEAKRGLPA